ncbi:MAG: alpha/beta fold hydrolase [Proteobacteria bacterium]|nr:alpha/beta fold hydrolase [Pseudomonadota bacterium]
MKIERITAAVAAAVLSLTCAVGARAAAPDPHAILADVGKVVSKNGIDEARAVEIGGIKQWIRVRGRDRNAPILPLIHGGPAAPDLPNSYLFERGWDDYFTVVEWDQRGSGKTYELNDPKAVAPTLHVERMVQDAEEMVAYLRKTYDRKKIFLMGHSWGSLVGLSVAERRPDWLYAYISAGQMLDFVAQESAGYAWVLGQAKADGNATAIKELEAIAPYPEPSGVVPVDKIDVERKWSVHYGGLTHGWSTYDVWENAEKISPDYSETDFQAIDQGSGLSFPSLLPEMAKANLSTIAKLGCPLIVFAGRYDYTTPTGPVRAWYERLQAPSKRWVWFEHSAHMMYLEEPGRALVHLVQDALPLADADADAKRAGAGKVAR